ncbi:hypothetical protein ZPR_4555 [Zunongwangia profunda SM-A87]|uniref:Uncharacterized protein n=1 Tax=Zunongwangia profunda (strain DSM 18752 / CCTCC AB 206139 / SM-A87) TaxID=655815 RepID=D5BDE9_ZUNPS|nr:hypothetical protein ZPR_4555 [Zunongwangia profunda SM-A87]
MYILETFKTNKVSMVYVIFNNRIKFEIIPIMVF